MFRVSLLLSLLHNITSLSFHGAFLNELEINFVIGFGLQTNSSSSLVLKINREKKVGLNYWVFALLKLKTFHRESLTETPGLLVSVGFFFMLFSVAHSKGDKIVMSF